MAGEHNQGVREDLKYAVSLIELETGTVRATFRGHTSEASAIGFTSGGEIAFAATKGSVILWSVQSGDAVERFERPDMMGAVDLSPDGRTALITAGPRMELRDVSSGAVLKTFGRPGLSVSLIKPLDAHTVAMKTQPQLVPVDDEDETVDLWNFSKGAAKEVIGSRDFRVLTAISTAAPKGDHVILTGGTDGAAVWRRNGGALTRTLLESGGGVDSVLLSADGTRAMVRVEGENAQFWSLTGRSPKKVERKAGWFGEAAFSKNAELVVLGDKDGGVTIWDFKTAKQIRRFSNADSQVRCVAISPDSKYVFAGGRDSSRLWNVRTGKPVLTEALEALKICCPFAFSREGRSAIASADDGLITGIRTMDVFVPGSADQRAHQRLHWQITSGWRIQVTTMVRSSFGIWQKPS